ncbi:hypothetical protein S83_028455, partial [Arachis hypogaea]
VTLLKEKLGFDNVFNYKEETNLNTTFKSLYYRNLSIICLLIPISLIRTFLTELTYILTILGGEMLEAAIANMNAFGRITICG